MAARNDTVLPDVHGGLNTKPTDQHIELAAVTTYDESQLSMWQALKANPRVILYSVIVNLGPILYGYDVIVSGAIVALPGFLDVYGAEIDGYLSLPATWQALWTAFVQLGIMVGALSGGWVQDRFGRRLSFFLGGFISAIGVGIAFGSCYPESFLSRRLAFFFAKICIGLGMGFLVATCQTYISEIASPKIRGPLLGLYTFMSTVGQIISITIIFKRVTIMDISSFEIPFATQWVFSGLCMIAAIVIPESPVYLLSKSRVEAAEASYRRLHGPHVDSHAAISRLWATVEHEQDIAKNAKSVGFLDCFKGIDVRRTRIILILNAIPQFCGIAVIANGTYYMELCGMNATESFQLAEIGIGLLMVSTVISWFAISTIGRRLIIIMSPIMVGLLYMGMGVAGTFPVTDRTAWAAGVMLILICFFYGTGLGTAFPVTAAEVSSVRLRAKSSGLGFFMNAFSAWVFAFVSPYMYSPGAGNGNLGAKTGFVFMGLSFMASVIAYFVIPETKGLSYAQIDYLFENKTRTHDFLKPSSLLGFEGIREGKADLVDKEENV